jgi:mRNA-degrading endonuclease RelE of RelBE toxin-antitoxin system
MAKRAGWTDRAKADLRAIDQATALRILQSLSRYLQSGNGDVKRLQNVEPPEFRLRVGNYRVRFHDHGDSIVVTAVQHRREAYR